MSQNQQLDQTLQNTIAKDQVKPKKVLEDMEVKQEQIVNDSKIEDPNNSKVVAKSNSENSLNNVNLADSILPDNVDKQESKQNEEQVTQKMAEDFYYEPNHIETLPTDSPITQAVTKLDGFFGHDSFKRYNALVLDRDHIIFASGISYTIYNHFTKQRQDFYSKDGGGIGSIAVHPTKKYFAVAEMGVFPNIYIYEYPSLKVYRILRKGTEKAYSSINFSQNGDMLASVGSEPDFLLTVWEWRQQKLLLKSKAFSQQVYKVSFNQFNQKSLTTCGTGHIRFWKISQTFTGLKLQGDIAKFGQFQLSDVISYAQYQDSNVLSSSQYGNLMLWEGNLVKSLVAIDPDTNCHKGAIEFVKLHDKKIITCGADGYVKFWDANQINQGQSDEKFNLYVKPEKQIYFESQSGLPANLNWIDIQPEYWIIQDALGTIYKYTPQNDKREILLTFNAGRFTDFAVSPLNNCIVSTGYDGYIRLWDYGNKREFYNRKFKTQGAQSTCIQWLPFSKKNNGRMLAVGFSDGIVRFVGIDQKGFKLIKAFKVHKNPIIKTQCNREGNVVVVVDSVGSMFFISLDPHTLSKIIPYCLYETGFKINDLSWDKNGQKVLIACQDGKLHEINAPKQKDCEYSQSFLHKHTYRTFTIKMMQSQKPNKADLELQLLLKKTKGGDVDEVVKDEQWQPSPILNATYYDPQCTKILCSVEGPYLGYLYVVDFNKNRPIASITIPKNKTSYLQYSQLSDTVYIGYRNGSWQLRHKYDTNNYLRKNCFDQNIGIVKKIALNIEQTALLSASEDGTLLSHKIDYSSFKKGVRSQSIDPIQITIPSVVLGISEATYSDKIDYGPGTEEDLEDGSQYCLQDQKLKAEEDMKLTEAQKVKRRKYQKIKELQSLFKQIVTSNNSQTDVLAKLSNQQLIVDPEYSAAFQKRVDEEEQETKKELAWDEQFSKMRKKKLQKYFIDVLEFDKFKVKGIFKSNVVSSFKMKKLTDYIDKELAKIQKIIQQQRISQSDHKERTSVSFDVTKNVLDKMKQTKKGGKQQSIEVRNKIRQAEAQFEKELAHANATIGDYKLKCASDYKVPENERLNVSRKKKHLFLHYQYLFEEKRQFNTRLDNLRKKKIELVQRLDPINTRIRQINKDLGVEEDDILFEIDEEIECIEADLQVTEQEINEHILQKQKQKAASKKASGMGMGANEEQQQNEDQDNNKTKKKKKKVVQKKVQKSTAIQIKARPNVKTKKSALEEQLKEIHRIKLESEKNKLKDNFMREIEAFDDELENLKTIKYHLQSDLNLVQMKILTFSQEYIIFRDMETEDNHLMNLLQNYGTQRTSLANTFMQLSTEIAQVESLNDDYKKKYEEQKRILKEFVYPEDDEMRQRIIRYYKIRERKRISKLKKQAQLQQKEKEKQQKQEQDEEQDQESEEQQQDSESDDEFEDEDEKPDITVVQNDHKNFQRVRKICEYDQKIEEYSKKKSDLQKQRKQIDNKINSVKNSLQKSELQLQAFQKKKLLKVNQVNVSLPVKLSQVQYLVNMNNRTRVQEQFSHAILFTHSSFNRLGERIQQLKKQKIDIEKKQKVLNKKLGKLREQVEKASETIESKRKQYQQKQLLKFGSTFELEKLKQLEPTQQLIEMRTMYKKQQREVSKRIEQIKQELQQGKRQLLQSKRQNTKVINEITDLGDRQNDLKKKLDSTNKQLFKNYDASKKDELEKQRQNLNDLIKFLSKEIEDLKTQIGLFKRKGGHIYTMVTSNKKNFS